MTRISRYVHRVAARLTAAPWALRVAVERECRMIRVNICIVFLVFLLTGSSTSTAERAEVPARPRVAVFPLAGDSAADLRERVGFAIRTKIVRDGTYDVIEGVTMAELAAGGPALASKPADVAKLVAHEKPAILIWGEIVGGTPESLRGAMIRVKILDLRQLGAKPVVVENKIAEQSAIRFATEEIIATLAGVGPVRRPNERVVIDDENSRTLWEKNPNLVGNGDFSDAGGWDAIFHAERYRIGVSTKLPAIDKIGIYAPATGADGESSPVLAMVLSRDAAENAGLACLSDPIRIQPGRRYRISFRYKSERPMTLVFVKGYTTGKDIKGRPAERECFRTQVPAAGEADGQWHTIAADVNPYHPSFQVETLRVDLYAYLHPGVILWDDVVVKEIGPLTKQPDDAAIEKPVAK